MIINNTIACRICLSSEIKLYHVNTFQLKSYYEEIINDVVAEDDKLLNFFCYQCSAMLQKYHSFRELCIKSQDLLKKTITQNVNIPFEENLNWQQYINKIHPFIKKLNSTAKLGYFEYQENGITVDPLVNNSMQTAEISNPNFDNEENFESKSFDSMDNFDYKDYASEDNFEESTKQESNNVKVSDKKPKYFQSKKNAYSKSNEISKKSNSFRHLDTTKWKTVILSNKEASEQFFAKIQKQRDKHFNKYICEYCQSHFRDKARLINHMSCHSEANGKYECFLCKRRYLAKYKLMKHMRLHLHKYHCLRCPQVFSNKFQTALHDKYHEGVQYVCPHCDATFQHMTTFYSHLRIIHRSSHLCQFCGASFISQAGLQLHKARVHKSNDSDGKGVHCEKCDMMFKNPQAFLEHERNSDKHITEDGGVLGRNKTLLKGAKSKDEACNQDTDGTAYCKKCDMMFENPETFLEHKRNSFKHITENGSVLGRNKRRKKAKSKHLVCNQCSKKFLSRRGYGSHMHREHNIITPEYEDTCFNVCEICGVKISFYMLAIHMNIHTGKRFPCPKCDKHFSSATNMARHLQLHKNPKPFACEFCDKKFVDATYVKLHMKTVHHKQPHPPKKRTRKKFASLSLGKNANST